MGSDSTGIYFRYDDQGDSKVGFYLVDGTFKKLPITSLPQPAPAAAAPSPSHVRA